MRLQLEYKIRKLDDLLGQEHIINDLNRFIFDEKPHNIDNIIFQGPNGVGKTDTMELVAMHVTGIPTVKEINNANYRKLAASTDRKLENIRTDVLEFVQTASIVGGRKFMYFEEAWNMDYRAIEAMKNVMDDYKSACYSFTTNRDLKEDIYRRAMLFRFRPIPDDIMLDHLKKINKEKEIGRSHDQICDIVLNADGDMGDGINKLMALPTLPHTRELIKIATESDIDAYRIYRNTKPNVKNFLVQASRLIGENDKLPVETRMYLIEELAWHESWVIQGVTEATVMRSFLSKLHGVMRDLL